jgi:hypothetical protein
LILEKLDTIHWHELSHAYGAADDVPQLLRDVASRKEKKRTRAYRRLYSTLYHQGTIYQASAYAAPFLIELLKDEHVPARHDIIALLVALASGDAYLRHYMESSREEKKQSTEFQEQFAEEVYWAKRTYQAVREGIDTYLTLLTHKKRRLRMSAISILGWFKEDRAKLIPTLSTCLQAETNQLIRSCIVFSLGQLVEYGSEQYGRLVLLLTGGEIELVRIAAAMALVHRERDHTPTRAIEVLFRAVEQHRTWEDVYAKLPWSEMRFVFDVMKRLYDLPPLMNGFVVPQLLQLLTFFDEQKAVDELNDDIALAIAQLLLYLIFRNVKVEEGTTFEDLSSEQQQVLQAIVSTDAIVRTPLTGGRID